MFDNDLSRRGFVRLLGAAAAAGVAGPAITACSSGSTGSGVGSAGAQLAAWPTYAPFAGPKPELPAGDGIQAGYLKYPSNLVASVQDKPGDGSTITAMVISYGPPPKGPESNAFWKAINDALGVDLKVIVVPEAEYPQKMATLFASNDLPDIIHIGGGFVLPREAEFVATKGQDLSEFLSGDKIKDYPNLANLPTYAWQSMGRISGRIYGVPVERPLTGTVMMANRDLLGGTGPWSSDDLISVMTKVTDSRRWGLGASKSGNFGVPWHSGCFGVPNVWSESGGAFTSMYDSPQFAEMLAFVLKLKQAGLYYPDALTASQVDMKTKFESQGVASLTDGYLGFDGMARKELPFTVDIARPYAGSAKPASWLGSGKFGYTILKKASNERVQLILRVLNYLAAPFGSTEYELLNYGVEGKHFTRSSSGITKSELAETENNTSLPVKYLAAGPYVTYYPENPEAAKRTHAYAAEIVPAGVQNPAIGLRSDAEARHGATIAKQMSDAINGIVSGRQPLSDLAPAVKKWKAGGGAKIAEEFAKELAANR